MELLGSGAVKHPTKGDISDRALEHRRDDHMQWHMSLP